MGRQFVAASLLAAGALLASLPASAAPTYEVVLASGVRMAASSRPLLAMGKVSFLDESRRPVSLPTSVVDVDATRARLGQAQSSGKVWDEKSLRKLDASRIQFYGEVQSSEPESAQPGARPDAGNIEQLRSQIDGLNEKIRTLPTTDRQRSLMVIRQLELQQELMRVLNEPAARG